MRQQRRYAPLATSDALSSKAETQSEPSVSHSPGLGGGGTRASEGRADAAHAGTNVEGGDNSRTEPCMELESVTVIGRAYGLMPS
jgi:hypothetical protein